MPTLIVCMDRIALAIHFVCSESISEGAAEELD